MRAPVPMPSNMLVRIGFCFSRISARVMLMVIRPSEVEVLSGSAGERSGHSRQGLGVVHALVFGHPALGRLVDLGVGLAFGAASARGHLAASELAEVHDRLGRGDQVL